MHPVGGPYLAVGGAVALVVFFFFLVNYVLFYTIFIYLLTSRSSRGGF